MNVKELIELLKEVPDEYKVTSDDSGLQYEVTVADVIVREDAEEVLII